MKGGVGGQGWMYSGKVCGWPDHGPPHTCPNNASTEVPEEQSLRKLSWGGWEPNLPHPNLGVGDSGLDCGWARAAGSGAVVQ